MPNIDLPPHAKSQIAVIICVKEPNSSRVCASAGTT